MSVTIVHCCHQAFYFVVVVNCLPPIGVNWNDVCMCRADASTQLDLSCSLLFSLKYEMRTYFEFLKPPRRFLLLPLPPTLLPILTPHTCLHTLASAKRPSLIAHSLHHSRPSRRPKEKPSLSSSPRLTCRSQQDSTRNGDSELAQPGAGRMHGRTSGPSGVMLYRGHFQA